LKYERIPMTEVPIGKQFGEWTVIGDGGQILGRNRNHAYWRCECTCGTIRNVLPQDLKNGHSRSCGCLYALPYGEASFNSLLATYKRGAKRRNLPFRLTRKQFRELTKGRCRYCGDLPYKKHTSSVTARGKYIYNGIDRIDNGIGYEIENCVSCCRRCNVMKSIYTEQDLYSHILKIAQNQGLLSTKYQKISGIRRTNTDNQT